MIQYSKKSIFTIFLIFLVSSVGFTANAEVESPKKQMDQGISAQNVLCNYGLELIIRNNGFAACVKPITAEKMKKAGMLLIPIEFTTSEKEIKTIPASSMTIVNFYVIDDDLNLAHSGIEVIPTTGLLEFTINGVPIKGPEKMIETGPDTGQFYVKLELPKTINGVPLSQKDIVLIKYLDESDDSGEQRVLAKSVPLTKTFSKIQTAGGGSRIGHEFTVRLYEPDSNRDSKEVDKIPLREVEYRGSGGIRTTLDNPRFDANRGHLYETGPNTNVFEVKITIPRQIDGKPIHIGDWYEMRYIDRSTPSNTDEKIILEGRIG